MPVAFVSAVPAIPLSLGVPRVVRGVAITHVLGDPALPLAREADLLAVVDAGRDRYQDAVVGAGAAGAPALLARGEDHPAFAPAAVADAHADELPDQ